MEIKFSSLKLPKTGVVVFLVNESLKLSKSLKQVDKDSGGVVERAIKSSDFKGKKGKFLSIVGAEGFGRIILLGTGGKKANEKDGASSELDAINLGGNLCSYLNSEKVKTANVIIEEKLGKVTEGSVAANIAYGVNLKSYYFGKYFTKKKKDELPSLTSISFLLQDSSGAKKLYSTNEGIAKGVFLARDVVSEPPNVIYPDSYAKRMKKELTPLGVKVEILDVAAMKKLGMGALLGVGQGSRQDSRMVIMQWNGAAKKTDKPVAFVGKGVTFDTGGISIKPSNGMEEMKYDMGGSASVVGTICALAARKAKVNAVGVIGLAENMPDGNAQRPSDVVTSMSGQTIEVLNTDAEGRLVLADALWYTQDRFKATVYD